MAEKMKGINYAIMQTKQRITDVINEAGLPPACMLLILGEATSAVAVYAQQYAETEKEEFEKEDSTDKETEEHD